ncbi:MAG: succinylglutamate desuccinylase/aspartoacylase family protein [Bdellovibrionales bacterium]
MKPSFYHMHEIHSFSSLEKGPNLLVFGAIHGNEVCGPAAIRKIIPRMQKGQITLNRGSVTFVPVCNPLAYKKGKRYIEKNLNRVIAPQTAPQLYEEKLAGQLVPLIDACDWILDLHSYEADGPAFVFQDVDNKKTETFARCLGSYPIVTGWLDMYAAPDASVTNGGDTVSYAHLQGKTGVVIECGQHNDPQAILVAEKAILSAMRYLGLTAQPKKIKEWPMSQLVVKGYKVFSKRQKGRLVKKWKHLDPVKKGEVIAVYHDGTQETADHDAFIMLPNNKVSLGEEWFYLGKGNAVTARAQ